MAQTLTLDEARSRAALAQRLADELAARQARDDEERQRVAEIEALSARDARNRANEYAAIMARELALFEETAARALAHYEALSRAWSEGYQYRRLAGLDSVRQHPRTLKLGNALATWSQWAPNK